MRFNISTRLTTAVLGAFIGSMAGILSGTALIRGGGDPVSVLASLATLGAAIAAFLTVREMQEARKLAARARIGFGGAAQPLRFLWNLRRNVIEQLDGAPLVTLRNTTSGSADGITATWRASNKITSADVASANNLLPAGRTVSVGNSTYEIILSSAGSSVSIPLAGMDTSAVGDIGPAQEIDMPVPAVVLNYAILKWMALFDTICKGDLVAPDDVPCFSLSIVHGNAYLNTVTDEHSIRFVILSFIARDSSGAEVTRFPSKAVVEIEATIVPELAAVAPHGLGTVTVRGIHAG